MFFSVRYKDNPSNGIVSFSDLRKQCTFEDVVFTVNNLEMIETAVWKEERGRESWRDSSPLAYCWRIADGWREKTSDGTFWWVSNKESDNGFVGES